MTYLF
jgi:hypothetical protein